MSQQSLADETNHPTACDVLYEMGREAISENATLCLRHSWYPELQKVTCDFYEGMLTMHGVVSSYFLKQIALALVAGVKGIEEVANHLEVRYPTDKLRDRKE